MIPTPSSPSSGAPVSPGSAVPSPGAVAPEGLSTHPCVRCGRPIPVAQAVCDRCNPAGLAQPAAAQIHGTIALGVVAAVVLLILIFRLSVVGVGPFDARVVAAVPTAQGLQVTLQVTNRGTRPGSTSCRVFDATGNQGGSALLETPSIQGGSTVSVTRTFADLSGISQPAVVCQ